MYPITPRFDLQKKLSWVGTILRRLSVDGLLALTLASVMICYGQSQSALSNINVSATVTASMGDILLYSYEIANPASSASSIWLFALDIVRTPEGAILPNTGLVNAPGFFTNTSDLVLQKNMNRFIPVGVQAPVNWDAGISNLGRVEWSAPDSSSNIIAGQSFSGFALSSHGLPGIRRAIAQAPIDYDNLPIRPPSDDSDLQRYVAELSALQSKATATTATIGPTAPPAVFVAADFLKAIISYKEQAVQQGWIKSAGVANSLDAKLNAAQGALARGDNSTAKNQLFALLNEVDAQSGKQASSEAVAGRHTKIRRRLGVSPAPFAE